MLHEFVATHREEITTRCRAMVASRSIPLPRTTEIDHGVPMFLDQLINGLRLGLPSSPEIARTALLHGHDLLAQGFSVSDVVHDYGDVCQSITELAAESNTTISADDFRVLNRCLDDAIAGAITEYAREQRASDIAGAAASTKERVDALAHQLGILSKTALVAFDVIKTGNVGAVGSTGALLHRSLTGISTLVGGWLKDVDAPATGVSARPKTGARVGSRKG